MSQKVKLSNDTIIEVSNTPFASGGEGDVFEILSPASYTKQILKIYKPVKRTQQKENKLNFLVSNKPNLLPVNDHHSVIWPTHLAYVSNKFIGYTMPKASGIKLELLCHPKLPKDLSNEWDRFSFSTPGAIEARLKLCFNISAALSQIHSFGSYVLVDMKPDNVMVKPDGLISIIDIDSTEIIRNNLLLFSAQVATPEYTPPEYYRSKIDIEKDLINEAWDRFSLAVIFYRVLFGIHPFTASLKSPFDNLTNVSDIIKKGFLPVGTSKDKFRTIPPPHEKFYKLEKNIQQLFINALEEGAKNPNIRPTADDWCRILSPNPVIQINRLLPSKAFPCLVPVYSKGVQIKSLPQLKIDKPAYLSITNSDGIVTRLIRFFKKSDKEKLYDNIVLMQRNVDQEYGTLEFLKSQCESERNKATQEVIFFLQEERSIIDATVDMYLKRVLQIDKRAEALFYKEAEEYFSFEKAYINEVNSIDLKIKQEFQVTVNSFENNYTKELDTLHKEFNKLNSRETEQIAILEDQLKIRLQNIKDEIQKLEKTFSEKIDSENQKKLDAIKVKRNLLFLKEKKLLTEALEKYQATFTNNNMSQYKIADERYSIFSDSYANPDKIIMNLSRNGIVTAADIKGVDESGRILKANGTWVKVPEVAAARARKLDEWRRRKGRTSLTAVPPQTLPYSEELKVKNKILPELNILDEEERLVRMQILQSKNSIPNQIAMHLNEAKRHEAKITAEVQAKKLNILRICKTERDDLQQRIYELTNSYGQLKKRQEQIFEKKTEELRNRIEKLRVAKDQFYAKTKIKYDPLHDALIKEIRVIDDQFKLDLEKIRRNTDSRMVEKKHRAERSIESNISRIKEHAIAFNSAVNQLLLAQARYSGMQ